MSKNEDDYLRGYRDASADARRDLGAALRTVAVDTGEEGAEKISDTMAREIFASTFGVRAADEEFGPEPSGKGVRAALGLDEK